MTNKGGIVVSALSRSSTTRSAFGATSVDTEASSDGATGGPCRFCGAELLQTFVDLGMSPPVRELVEASQVNAIEAFYPLRVYKTVVGYGAPGKRNTLLSYGGIRTDFIDFAADRNPYKQRRSCRVPTSQSIHRRRSPRSSPT
jgi:C-methyltransferase C-terminal domain/Putative zinc binding domain